jgi:8-oxo-dGTP pyrophosphatase MutT (NUDIX family)
MKQKIRRQYAAFALIVIGQSPMRRYLLQWNPKWGVFNLIGGKAKGKREDALFHTIMRELEEEMGLRASTEFQVIRELASVQMAQYSPREQRIKDYFFAIFEVDIFPTLSINCKANTAIRWLSTEHENILVSADEIENLCTSDGKPISPTTKAILQSLGELPTMTPPIS